MGALSFAEPGLRTNPYVNRTFPRSFMLLTTEYIIEYAAFRVIERLD